MRTTTKEHIDRMVELYEQGYSTGEIGEVFGKHNTTVVYHLKNRGITSEQLGRQRKRKKKLKKRPTREDLREKKRKRDIQLAQDARNMTRSQLAEKYQISKNRVSTILSQQQVKPVQPKKPRKPKKKTDWRQQCVVCGSKDKNFKFRLSPYCSLECFKSTIPKDETTIYDWIKRNRKT